MCWPARTFGSVVSKMPLPSAQNTARRAARNCAQERVTKAVKEVGTSRTRKLKSREAMSSPFRPRSSTLRPCRPAGAQIQPITTSANRSSVGWSGRSIV